MSSRLYNSQQKTPIWSSTQRLNTLQVLRLLIMIAMIVGFFGPWYTFDNGQLYPGIAFSAEIGGWTLGMCCLPHLLSMIAAVVLIIFPNNGYASLAYLLGIVSLGFICYVAVDIIGQGDSYGQYWGLWMFIVTLLAAGLVEIVLLMRTVRANEEVA